MARLIWCAWSKVASVGVGVSTFESTGIYTVNRNRVTEYLFSVSDTGDKIVTAPPNMAVVCVSCTSVTNSQNVLHISAEPSLSNLSTIFLSELSPEEITSSGPLQKISLLQKISRKYSGFYH
jgi:hypothetical protein